MRVTKLARILIGITSLFVTGVYLDEVCVILPVKPSWRLPRCSGCGRICPGYDHRHRPVRWVHLGIGDIRLILEYTPRRVECPRCGVRVEMVPWARPGSRFTKPFEEMTAYLAQIHDTHRIVWAAKGKSAQTLDAFFEELGEERRQAIEIVTIDMSAAFIKSIEAQVPGARMVFDLFHVLKLASEAVDEVRREKVRELKGLDDPEGAAAVKKSRYTLLKNPWDLSAKEWDKLSAIQRHNVPLYRAYLLKETLAAVFEEESRDDAEKELDRWLAWASRSRLGPFVKAARTVRKYKEGILAYIETKLTNGLVEGLNNKLRMIARRAFGFHSAGALISMLFLCCGGVEVTPPLPTSWCPW